jgi:hypothetical protein
LCEIARLEKEGASFLDEKLKHDGVSAKEVKQLNF